MKPIIKWPGGKYQSRDKIKEKLPESWNTYYEPFLGGGAVLLGIMPSKAIAGDLNAELINMYQKVKDDPEEVITCLGFLDSKHEAAEDAKEFYYRIRDEFNTNLDTHTVEQAARLIYLNKHCFNGLYRVNSKGKFNVPFNGKLEGSSVSADHVRELSTFLDDVVLCNQDYLDTLSTVQPRDLVFLDSPYMPLNPTSFTDYTKEGFTKEDHERLAEEFKRLDKLGAYCILTNHDTPLIRELYKDYNIETIEVRRSINRNGGNRKGTEVIITNYD